MKQSTENKEILNVESLNPSEIVPLKFYPMRKAHLLDNITKIAEKERNTITDLNGVSTITHKDISVKFNHGNAKSAITAATWQFLDFLLITHNESGKNERQIIFSIDDFMTKRGLSNRKYAARVIKKHISQLGEIWVSWKETAKNGNKTVYEAFNDIRILSQKAGAIRADGKGYFAVALTPEMYEYFQIYAKKILDYPDFLLKLDTNDNAITYYIGRKITEHKNIGTIREQENADFLSVKSLLAACPAIPTYNEVKKTDRMYKRRIIEALVKGLDGLAPYIKWNLAKAKNEPLTDEECENIENDINLFLNAYIKLEWEAYPDKKNAIEKRKKAINKAQKRHEKAKLNAETAIEKKKLEALEKANEPN